MKALFCVLSIFSGSAHNLLAEYQDYCAVFFEFDFLFMLVGRKIHLFFISAGGCPCGIEINRQS